MRETRSDRASSRDVDNGALQSLVAVAIDKDKGSQAALRWTVDNLMEKGQTLFLVHVKHKSSQSHSDEIYNREIFLPFRCYCTRKDVQCKDICLDGPDIAKSIVEFVSQNAVDKLVVSAPSKNTFIRFKSTDVSSSVSKGAPDFCTVYIISKGKVSSTRKAIRQAPAVSPLRTELESQKQKQGLSQASGKPDLANPPLPNRKSVGSPMFRSFEDSTNNIRSPFSRGGNHQSYSDISLCETDISFVSSGRPSSDRMFPSLFDDMEPQHRPPRLSNCSEQSFELMRTPRKSTDMQMIGSEYSGFSQSSSSMSWSSQNISMDEAELEMRRLKLELKQTMDMYNTACREALNAKQKAGELHRWKVEEEQKMQEARMAEETALAIAERERAKCRAAVEAAEASRRIAKLEEQKRMTAEMMAQKENEERKKVESAGVGVGQSNLMYRRYTIEEIEIATDYFAASRKVGEGGYGPVFKCYLDHTMAAVKVLRPDAAQGRSQFQQEVEVLSCIRHPNMVLLLGACPEYGCLVYEYLSNGSLEDRLFCKGNTPVLPWQLRFRIAAEIATGLLFLHQTKPEPLVHRDLKPANILLDRNFVSKISDVGLARLVPASVADSVTQYRMTSTAGTFCYIDPEYQQTGMLGTKSDVYSLGIMLLQIITAKPAMGLAHHAQAAIDNSTFHKFLDPAIPDWPLEEALRFAKIAIQCAELRRKDRPDLGSVVLPELNRLREFADAHSYSFLPGIGSLNPSPVHSGASMKSEDMSGPMNTTFESESGSSSFPDKQTGIP